MSVESPAPIDWKVLDELRQLQSPGEPDVVTMLIDLFVDEVPPLLAHLHTAIDQRNGDQLKRAAHSLKSSSGSVGARQLSALSADLEGRGRNNTLEGSEAILAQLEQEYERVCQALELVQRGE